MKRYKITYRESRDSETVFTYILALNSDHAEEKFFDEMEAEGGTQGLEILSVMLQSPRV